ncbi:MAG TPA: DUF2127 domain-containing protein [Acidobacteriaceae bacterium]
MAVSLDVRHGSQHNKWLVLIGAGKLFKALLLLALGFGALKLLHKDLADTVTHWLVDMRFDPESHFISKIIEKVAGISPHRLRQISVGIFCFAAMDVIEGTGLILERWWAEYLTLIVTASFVPWEIFEIIRHFTWAKIVIALLNIAVVFYLLIYLQGRIRTRIRSRAESLAP